MSENQSYSLESLERVWLIENRISILVELLRSKEEIVIASAQALSVISAASSSQKNEKLSNIIEYYSLDMFQWSDLKGGLKSRFAEIFRLFNMYKFFLDENLQDPIGYKDLNSLYDSIKLLHSQRISDVDKLKKDMDEFRVENRHHLIENALYYRGETEKLIDREDLCVFIPLTKAALQVWCSNTKWESNFSEIMFDPETKIACFFDIIVNHNNQSENLKMHVSYKELYFVDMNGEYFKTDFIHALWNKIQDLVVYAISVNGSALEWVPTESRNFDLCDRAIDSNGLALEWVPDQFKPDFYQASLLSNGRALKFIAPEHLTRELCIQACQQHGRAIQFVPKEFINSELVRLAVKQNRTALKDVSDSVVDDDLYLESIKIFGAVLEFLSEERKTQELCWIAVNQSSKAMKYVPEQFRTDEICWMSVETHASKTTNLKYVPDRFKTYELCLQAVQSNGLNIRFVPQDIKSYEIYRETVMSNGLALSAIEFSLRTEELCMLAVQQDGFALTKVPDEYITLELLEAALKQNALAYKLFKPSISNQDLLDMFNRITSNQSVDFRKIQDGFMQTINLQSIEKQAVTNLFAA